MRIELSPLKEWMIRSAALFGRAARAIDRSIRRLEDRHRGPLPYMRRPAEHPEFSSRKALRAIDREAPKASVAALTAARAAAARGEASRAMARRMKALADELAVLTTAFCDMGRDAGENRDAGAGRGRAEPVWATGLGRRFGRFVTVAEQWSSPPPAGIRAVRNALRPSRPRPLQPPRPDLP